MGIAVRDIRGNTMPALTVLKNLSDSYNDLGASTKAAVAEQVGGVFQINVLKAALKDLNKENSLYSQATRISSQATDQAQRKNEQLQKTISALAAQTSLTLQELASNIGDLTLAPGISQILEAVNSFGEGLNNLFGKNSEGLGADFAKGIMRGLGSVLAGPGVVLAFGVFAKLFSNALKFAKSSLKDILGIVTAKDRERGIQESIVMAMSQNKQLAIELNKYSGDKTKQEQIMLGVIKEQTHFLRQQQKTAATIAPGLARAGVNQSLTMGKNRSSKAEGFIPNFASSGVTPYEKAKEESMAAKAGYRSGQVKKMNMLGLGEVIYNTNESVKMFSGMKQPAIIPPEDSRAGSKYGSKFMNKHGFDPYSPAASASEGSSNNSTYHKGFVPNFALPARQTGTMLNLPKAKMFVQHPRDRGWKKMESPLDNVAAKAARLKPMISELEKLGITALSRSFYFANQDASGRTSGARKVSDLGRGFSNDVVGSVYEEGLYNNKKSGLKGKGFIRTSNDSYKIKGKTATKKSGSGDGQGVVDFVRPGRLPIEAKHGYSPANLLAKSIFQASDTSVEEFLRKSNVNTSKFSSTKEARAVNTARKLRGYKGADISDTLHLGLSGGFIPNYSVKGIVGVTDGDSVTASIYQGVNDIDHRLSGVDAVEKDQAFGSRATALANKFYGKNDTKAKRLFSRHRKKGGTAAYNRGLFENEELSTELVSRGYGVPDIGYMGKAKFSGYAKLIDKAKKSKRGIWGPSHMSTKGEYLHPKARMFNKQLPMLNQKKPILVRDSRYDGARDKTGGWGGGSITDESYLKKSKNRKYARGLIPNFIDPRNRQQKIQAVLSDPANKGIKFNNKLNNTKTFKTQARGGMFHSMYVESYLKTGNQSDLNYLVKVGYNKQELISLRRHKKSGGRVNVRGKGFVPNFLKTQEFSRTSRGASQFNSTNGLDLQTALSGGKGFRLSKFNFDKVRQFLNSSQFRQLPENIQTQLLNKLKIQSKFVKMGDVTRPYLKGKTSFPGRIAASSGFIPNFSSPLEDAISREKAAGIPKSMMKIESDPSLVMPENPLGLGVTNTRDEPAGIKQGINRAISMGIDPKTHGSSNNSTYASGIIPNFAQTLGPATNDSRERAGLDKRAAAATKEATEATSDLTGRLFAITSLTYMLEGAFSDMEGQAGSTTKGFIGLVKGISQGALVFEALGPISKGFEGGLTKLSDKLSSSGGKIGKGFGGLVGKVAGAAKALPFLGAAVAGIMPIFDALKQNTDWFDSGLDALRKSAEKTSKTIDALGTAITSAESVESSKKELTELNNSAMAGTFEGEMKRLKLNQQLVKEQSNLAAQSGKLASQLDLTESEIKEMTSGTAAGMMKLQKAMLQAGQSIAMNTAVSSLITATEGNGDWVGDDGKDPLQASIEKTNIANMVATSTNDKDIDSEFQSLLNTLSGVEKEMKERVGLQGTEGQQSGLSIRIAKRRFAENDDLSPILKMQVQAALKGKLSIEKLKKHFEDQRKIVKELNNNEEEKLKIGEGELEYGRETKKLKQSIANALAMRLKQAKFDLQFSKKEQSMTAESVAFRVKYNESLGKLTGAQKVQEAMTAKELKLRQDFANTQQEITDKYSAEGNKFISSLFKKPTGVIAPKLRQSTGVEGEEDEKVFSKSKDQLRVKLKKTSNSEALHDLPEVQKSLREFMTKLPKIESGPRIEAEFEKFLTGIQDLNVQEKTLIALQETGVIPKSVQIKSEMERLSDLKKQESDNAKKVNDEEIKNLDLVRKKLNMEKSTLAYNQEKLKDLQNTPHHELDAVFKDELETSKSKLDFTIKDLRNKEIYQRDGEGLVLLQSEQLSEAMKSVALEREATRIKRARIAAEEANLSLQQEVAKSIREGVQSKNEGLPGRLRNLKTESQEKSVKNKITGKNTFESNTEESLLKLSTESDDLAKQFKSDRNAGLFVEEALSGMGQSARDYEKAMIKAKTKLDNNEFAREGLREIGTNRMNMLGKKQNLQAQLGSYQSEDNSGRSSEVALELAQHEKELNFERGNGTLFADSLAVKIAEANVQMERFGETLANTAFDSVKDGFKGMLKDMGDSSKSVGDTILNFFGGIAGKIHDALVERAAAQITSGIFEMTGMSKSDGMYKGGMVSRYAAGGSTRSVPAMLTAGEVVVRKKVVDRLGKGSLDKINQSGSLEDLYDKPNQDNFEMFNSGGVVAPSIMRLKDGGSIDNYLAKRNKGTDRVSQNERTTVDGEIVNSFTNTLAKFMGGMVKMNYGGKVLGGLQSSKDDTAGEKIAKGGGYLAGSSLAAYQGRKDEGYQGPTAPQAPQKLNTNSTLDIDPTSRMMSARYRSQDQYSKDHGKYLLDKYQYDTDQKNAKVKGRASMLQAIGGSAALAGGMALGNKMFNKKGPDMSDTLTEKDMNKKARNHKDYTVNGVTINGNYNNPDAGRTNYFKLSLQM